MQVCKGAKTAQWAHANTIAFACAQAHAAARVPSHILHLNPQGAWANLEVVDERPELVSIPNMLLLLGLGLH